MAPAETGAFHGGVAQGFQLLEKVGHGAASVVLLRALHNADSIHKAACHGGNPALAGNAVGVHGQKDFVLCNLECTFQSAFLGACNLRKVRRQAKNAEPGVILGKLLENFLGAVGGTVVHANDFPFSGVILGGQGFQGSLGEFFLIAHGNHHRYAGSCLRTFVTARADKSYNEE